VITWVALPSPAHAHAFYAPHARLSACGLVRLDSPAGSLPDSGPGPHRERHPADECSHCMVAIAIRLRNFTA
jgi:hypothetical protein